MDPSSDLDLLEAWRAGDRDAGGRLFDAHLAAVTRFFKNKVDGSVEDLVQDTFLACVEGRDRFEGRSTFRTYLFSVARNVLYGHYRRQRRAFDPLGSSVVELGASLGSVLVDAEQQRLLLRALRELPVDHQVALELYYWEHLKGPELAEVLEISPHTVRSRLSRGRALLRERVAELATRGAGPGLTTMAEIDALAERLMAPPSR